MTQDAVGALIASLRKEKKMTQGQLAEKMRVTDKAVSKWERGLSYPDITLMPRLAEELGVTVSEMMSGAGDSSLKRKISGGRFSYFTSRSRKAIFRLLYVVVSCMFVVVVAASLIVNFALLYVSSIDTIWWPYPVLGILCAWIPYTVAYFVPKGRKLLWISILIVLLTAYMFVVQYLTGTKGWVLAVYIPILLLSVVSTSILVMQARKQIRVGFIVATAAFFAAVIHFAVNKIVAWYLWSLGDATTSGNLDDFISGITVVALLAFAACAFLVTTLRKSKD